MPGLNQLRVIIFSSISLVVFFPGILLAQNNVGLVRGMEGYFVSLPSGDIYLFPYRSDHESRRGNGRSVSNISQEEKAQSEKGRLFNNGGHAPKEKKNDEPDSLKTDHEVDGNQDHLVSENNRIFNRHGYLNYPLQRHSRIRSHYYPHSYNNRRPLWPQWYYQRPPVYLPRFDAAKSLNAGQH